MTHTLLTLCASEHTVATECKHHRHLKDRDEQSVWLREENGGIAAYLQYLRLSCIRFVIFAL